MQERYSHIDIARGIAIILVVLGHCCSKNSGDDVNRLILSFHMPLFFFLSGTFAKSCDVSNILRVVRHKAKTILLPQLLLAVTIALLRGIPHFLSGKSWLEFDFLCGILYWFLPTLFFCSVLHVILSCFINMEKRIVFGLVILCNMFFIFITLYVLEIPNDGLFKFLKLVPVSYLFYTIGFFFKNISLANNTSNNSLKGLFMLTLFPILIIISQLNEPVKMFRNEYGLFPLFFLSSLLGIVLVLAISKSIRKSIILQEFGRLSIAVYVWNFLVIGCVNVFLIKMSKIIGIDINNYKAALNFLLSIMILYCISKYSLRYFPLIYGQSKSK